MDIIFIDNVVKLLENYTQYNNYYTNIYSVLYPNKIICQIYIFTENNHTENNLIILELRCHNSENIITIKTEYKPDDIIHYHMFSIATFNENCIYEIMTNYEYLFINNPILK